MLIVTIFIGGIPAQAGHRGRGHTCFLKLGGEEEVLGDAVIIQGVEGEVTKRAGAFTNLGLERSSGSATFVHAKAGVIIVSHGAAFAFEAFSIKGHLAVLTVGDFGIQHLVGCEHKLVHCIVAFRNFRERQGVVVVKHGIVGRGRNLHEGERRGFGAGHLPYIRNLGSVELYRHGPDVGGTVAFGDGNELTLDDTCLCAVAHQGQIHVIVADHLEGQLLAFNSEQAVARREVEHVHRVGAAFGVHREVERLHPCTGGANAHIQCVDDFLFACHVLHVQLVAFAASASVKGESGLRQEVALRA